jgi:hypothetical protein
MKLSRICTACLLSLLPSVPAVGAGESIAGLKLIDLHGEVRQLGGRTGALPVAVVFIGTECPISRKSIPKLNALGRCRWARYSMGSLPLSFKATRVTMGGVLSHC